MYVAIHVHVQNVCICTYLNYRRVHGQIVDTCMYMYIYMYMFKLYMYM